MSTAALDGSNDPCRAHMVKFSPSMWGDTFSNHHVDEQVQEKYAEAIKGLKEEVRKKLISTESTKADKLILIDTLEHLGVGYHFEKEIEQQLNLIFESQKVGTESSYEDDLSSVALQFRLLRQHSYDVSCGVFDKFTTKDKCKFDEALIKSDAGGLLSLYEASQARIDGEEILDEAATFTSYHLNCMLPHLESPLQDKVKRALDQSRHRGVAIIEARYFIPIYQSEDAKDELLLILAKMNFNFLQNMYRKELCVLTRWWNEFDLKTKLPYARDRLVECYLWGVAFHFEPQYAFVRSTVCKEMQLVSVLDDSYDNYATVEEGQLFTKIFNKWDIGEIHQLPEYMQILYKFVWTTYQEHEHEASNRGRSSMIPYANDMVKQVGQAYLKELEWYNKRNLPTFEEYFANTIITSCIPMIFTPSFIGMPSASVETVEWIVSLPEMVVSTAKMGRHVEDLGSWERESRGGGMPTSVDCYMKQFNLSREDTLANFIEQVDVGWKNLNTARLKIPTSIPKDIANMFVNYARIAEVTYKNCQDGYTYPETFLAPQITALLIDPILL